jgi:PAS domain S-box-containing protein
MPGMPAQRFWRKFSLPPRWTLQALALMGLGAVTGLHLYMARERIERHEEARLLTQTRVIKENLEWSLTTVGKILRSVRGEIRQRPPAAELGDRLRTMTIAMPGVRTLVVIDSLGTVSASSRPELLGRNFAYRQYFSAPHGNPDPDRLFVSPPFETALGVYGINVSVANVDRNGAFAGVVSATLDREYFQTLLASVLYAPDMWSAIAQGDGLQFAMVPERDGQAGKNLAQPGSFFSRHLATGNEVDVLTGTVYATGERRMMAVRSIQATNIGQDKPLVVAVGRDLAAIYEGWWRDVAIEGGMFGVIAVGSVGGMAAYRRRQREFVQRQAETSRVLAAHERFLKALSDNVPGMVTYWDSELRCRYANQAYLEQSGRSVDQVLGASMADVLGPSSAEARLRRAQAALGGEPQLFEQDVHRPDGTTAHTLVQYIPDRVGAGVEGFFALTTDVTRQKREQEARLAMVVDQRDVLVREVHHRIKNNLQAVATLLRRELGRYEELRQPLEQAISQVYAIAAVHGLQGQSATELLRLGDMLGNIVDGSQCGGDPRFFLQIEIDPAVRLRIEKAEAVPLALILNELLRNATKHVCPTEGVRIIAVRMAGAGERAIIRISNAGAPLPAGFDFDAGVGFGTGLNLVRLLMPPHGATLSIRYRDGVVSAELTLASPVTAPESAGQ